MNTDTIRVCAAWTVGSLVVISFIFVLTFLVKPSSIDVIPHDFISTNPVKTNSQPIGGEQRWLDDLSHTVKPRACHSHNDYLRPYPLFSALAAGCSSVEADVWLTEDGTDLLVGHDEPSLASDRNLTSMYLDPLLSILDSVNAASEGTTGAETAQPSGVFRTEPNATLVLLIDVKTRSSDTWPLVVEQLSALRDKRYLTRYEDGGLMSGPITVVGSGNIVSDHSVFTSIGADPNRLFDEYHDSFLDAPLTSLPQAINTSQYSSFIPSSPDGLNQEWSNKTAYYASDSFKATIGSVITGFSPSQLSTLRTQIATAERLGLKSRYWDTPDWPVGYRDYVWGVLEREGVGMLNVDDLEGAARGGWNAAGQAWARDAAWMVSIGVWAICCGIAVVALGWKRRRPRMSPKTNREAHLLLIKNWRHIPPPKIFLDEPSVAAETS
ncbi:hypothetical protein FJTKL_04201 [Diaporthe vaccinii]|uniref:Altered inheritance of mitochondria protein 6 n=1 Tax=Diaporthe vaccinii TaxID=105482 RepID=A0ABR4DTA4_9PEZI